MPQSDLEQFKAFASDLAASTEKLANEIHSDRRFTKGIGRAIRLTFAVVILQFVVAIMLGLLTEGNKDRDRLLDLAEGNRTLLMKVEGLLDTMQDATTPTGCIAARSEAFRSEAVRTIVNDIRSLHDAPPKPIDPIIKSRIENPCPGEKP